MVTLDFWFPFFVFACGVILVITTEFAFFEKLAKVRNMQGYSSLSEKKPLAWLFFWVGGIWSLQNLWFIS
jgi:hypothetical protein